MCVNTAVRSKLVSDFPLTPGPSPELLQSAQGWGAHSPASAAGRFWGMSLSVLTPCAWAATLSCRWSSPCHLPVQADQPGWLRSATYSDLKLKMMKGFAWKSFWVCLPELSEGVGDEVLPP